VSLATFSPQELQRFTRDFEDLFYAADPAGRWRIAVDISTPLPPDRR
jgi:hypothetical protein